MRNEIFFLLTLMIVACAPSDSGPPDAQLSGPDQTAAVTDRPHAVLPGGQVLTLEIARSEAQRARGLMFRESLPDNHGMLFVFTESERHGFWMKNTFIPLDMMWLTEDGTVADIRRGVPPCTSDPCPSYVPDRAGRYVLELAAGEADRLGLVVGSRIELRNIGASESG